jgi:hypothetical protein
MRARTWSILAVVVAVAVGAAVAAQAAGAKGASAKHSIHLVLSAEGHAQFLDFEHDGFGFGDRLATRGPIRDPDSGQRVGTAYGDCIVASTVLEPHGKYWCRYVLELPGGQLTTEGLDPHGISDVLFSITGGTAEYRGASGDARFVDSPDQTDIYIDLG